MSDVLKMYTIYDRPSDFPHTFVVREFAIVRGIPEPVATGWFAVGPDLASVRAAVPPSADHRLARSPEDEPHIVETWL